MISIVIASVVFAAYVLFVYLKYGVLKSISHSSYKHKIPMLFFGFMSAIGICLAIYGYIQDDKWFHFLPIVAGILFVICGCSPFFHDKTDFGEPNRFESLLHTIGAEGGIIVMLMYMLLAHNAIWPLVAVGIPAAIMTKRKVKNHTWWIEIIAFVVISTSLFMV